MRQDRAVDRGLGLRNQLAQTWAELGDHVLDGPAAWAWNWFSRKPSPHATASPVSAAARAESGWAGSRAERTRSIGPIAQSGFTGTQRTWRCGRRLRTGCR